MDIILIKISNMKIIYNKIVDIIKMYLINNNNNIIIYLITNNNNQNTNCNSDFYSNSTTYSLSFLSSTSSNIGLNENFTLNSTKNISIVNSCYENTISTFQQFTFDKSSSSNFYDSSTLLTNQVKNKKKR